MGASLLTLAKYTLKGPYQAAAVVGTLAVLSVFLPPVLGGNALAVMIGSLCMLLSCVLVSLIILTQGLDSGLKPIVVSVLGITLVAWVVVNAPMLGLWVGLVQWLPIILLSQTLRSTRSLGLTLLAGVALGIVAIAAQHLLLGPMDEELVAQALQNMAGPAQSAAEMEVALVQFARLFVLALVPMVYLFVVLILLIARWTQASLAETKAFGEEFRALALGKTPAMIGLALVALSFWLQQPWLVSLVFLAVIAFMFQGIAVVHARLGPLRNGRVFLVVFYVLMFVIQKAVALTAFTGVIDNWLAFRKKKPSNENEIDKR